MEFFWKRSLKTGHACPELTQLEAFRVFMNNKIRDFGFITTDDGILKKADRVMSLRIVDPITFIKQEPS
jgi:hypothetical protein